MNREEMKITRICPKCGQVVSVKDVEKKMGRVIENKIGMFTTAYFCRCGGKFYFRYKRGFWKWLKVEIKRRLGLA